MPKNPFDEEPSAWDSGSRSTNPFASNYGIPDNDLVSKALVNISALKFYTFAPQYAMHATRILV